MASCRALAAKGKEGALAVYQKGFTNKIRKAFLNLI